jgi:hypothetical protein
MFHFVHNTTKIVLIKNLEIIQKKKMIFFFSFFLRIGTYFYHFVCKMLQQLKSWKDIINCLVVKKIDTRFYLVRVLKTDKRKYIIILKNLINKQFKITKYFLNTT